jgi:hypothetical protein
MTQWNYLDFTIVYHLTLQWAYNINHIEQDEINDNSRLKIIMNMCIYMYVSIKKN